MKSAIFFIFFLSCLGLIANGQDTPPQNSASRVSFGIKGGLNIANLEDNQEANTGALTGFHAGILAHIHLNNSLALQPEVVYSRQGAKYPNLGTEYINYVNIPILLQVMFNQGVRIQTGPQLGFLTEARLERESGGETDIRDQLENACLSWVIGAGYLSPIGVGIDARYNLGLINIVNDSPHDVKNRVWQFGLFYQFNRR
jgi:hypothetical protein